MSISLYNGMFVAPLDAPYAQKLVEACWRTSSSFYYTDDVSRLLPVIEYADDALVEKLLGARCDYSASVATEPSGKYEIPLPEGKALFGYQAADVEYILDRPSTLLAEDAGLGKSAIMIAVANTMQAKRILIICPSVAKYNWMLKEWPKWTTLNHLSIGVAESKFYPDTDVIIINYDILDRHKKALQQVEWDLLIVDESHRVKNKDAMRTQMVLGGTRAASEEEAAKLCAVPMKRRGRYKVPALNAKKRIFASATPMNRPKDLWTMVRECDPKGLGRDEVAFYKRYCAWRKTPFGIYIDGADNLKELGALMRARFMVRHDPEEVLDLPPLREEIFLLPPVKIVLSEEEAFVHDNIDALLNLAAASGSNLSTDSTTEQFLRLIGDAIIDNVSLIGKPEFQPLFSKFAEIRKQTGVAKVPDAVSFIKDISDDLNTPVVVFGYHREVMEELKKAFPDSAMVVGGMSSKDRSAQVDMFQEGRVNVFLGNIDAAGEAITLTRSQLLVCVEPDWRGTAMIQMRKRIHRITQNQPCSCYYLASANSFDAYVADKGFSKMANIKETLDL